MVSYDPDADTVILHGAATTRKKTLASTFCTKAALAIIEMGS